MPARISGMANMMSVNRDMTESSQPPLYPERDPRLTAISGEEGDDQTDRHRGAGPVDGAGVVVATLQVGAEPMFCVRCLKGIDETAVGVDRGEQLGEDRHDHHDDDDQSRDDEARLASQLLPGVAPETGRLPGFGAWRAPPPAWWTSGARISAVLLVVSVITDPRIEHGIHDVDHQIGDCIDDHENGHDPTTTAPPAPGSPVDRLPDPGMLKMVSVMMAPPISAPRSMARNVTTGMRVAEGVHPDHLALTEALGLGGADVVGAKVLHHAGAGEPGDIGQRHRGEDDRRGSRYP